MITATLTGNFSNHAHIYALVRTIAEKNNYSWGFNRHPEFDYFNGEPQMSFLDIDYGIEHDYKYNDTPPWITYTYREKYAINPDESRFYYYQPEIFNIKDGTKLFIPCGQNALYYDKDKLKSWFIINNRLESYYNTLFEKENLGITDDNLVVINMRGGEYKGLSDLILQRSYWYNAINKFINCKFIIITDDPDYANSMLPYPAYHFSIGMDYWIINNAKNLILSNSSFALFPAFLNSNAKCIIAPQFWARHNKSNGWWASSDISTYGFQFIDREGNYV